MKATESVFSETRDAVLQLFREFRNQLGRIEVTTKPDSTFLTQADLEIERRVIDILHAREPKCPIISEESTSPSSLVGDDGVFWIVDPIDGTREFINAEGTEFCSVLVRFEGFSPVAALLIAPELGIDHTPIICMAFLDRDLLIVNDKSLQPLQRDYGIPHFVSATRSTDVPERAFESALNARGIKLKTRTTSQSIDQLRLIVDLSLLADTDWPRFDLFIREQQKLWDGAVGFTLAALADYSLTDSLGRPLLPLEPELVRNAVPTTPSVVIGPRNCANWYLKLTQAS